MIAFHARRALMAGASTLALLSFPSHQAFAQDAQAASLPELVVTPTRSAQPIERSGSSVTVIPAAEIERYGSQGVGGALRGVAGLDVRETGGTGGTTSISLRGSNPGQTLVMIDGIRIGDPSGTDGAVDLSNIAPADIERIEVLRGPQSALYGSDAMGGVVNIITKKGERETRRTALVEVGSYGTVHSNAGISGATERWAYSFSVDALHSNGFPRYGYRVGRLAALWPQMPDGDPTNRVGVNARVSYKVSDDVTVEVGFNASQNNVTIDNPFGTYIYDRFNQSRTQFVQGFAKVTAITLDGMLTNGVTVFGNSTERRIGLTESCPDFTSNCYYNYRGTRLGAEYQGDLKLGRYGLLIFGARTEREELVTSQDFAPLGSRPRLPGNTASQTTNSFFALHQVRLGSAIDVSLGGRIDAVEKGKTFATWRATAAYQLTDTTKLRASVGTGAKSPSLYQRFGDYGYGGLLAEESIGGDVGVDQSLFDGRVKLSGTAFYNKYRNLIDFNNVPHCTVAQLFGCYYNVGRAETKGVELSAEAVIVPDTWRARASYTYMDAKNLIAATQLLQRPRNKGTASLIYFGLPGLELEGRMSFVGKRFDFGYKELSPYAKFDVFANYKVNEHLSVFARLENLTDKRYEEVRNYGVAGRSIFAGVKTIW